MSELLDANHWKVSQLIDELNASATERRALQLIELLKPDLSQDGNQFCFVYGRLPNDCVVGFGDTVGDAMWNFSKAFWGNKAVRKQ